MKIIRRKTVTNKMLLASLALVFSQSVFAADEKAKPELLTGASTSMISGTCAGCHGTHGVSNGPSIPTIAGMSPAYLVFMMEGYKSDEIPSTIMGQLAKGFTTEEFEQMGEYFSKQKFVAAKQTFDAEKAKKGAGLHEKYCSNCHSESGTVADDESGFLKGQWRSYLEGQLMDYQNKYREAPKKMERKLKKLHKKHGPAGIEALLEYYSSDISVDKTSDKSSDK